MAKEVIVTASKIRRNKQIKRIIKLSLLVLLLFLSVTYVILSIVYSESKFIISLDDGSKASLAIYESIGNTKPQRRLEADVVEFMDNITWKWLPADIGTVAEGSHNGENYIAYTFYAENIGDETINYWYEVNTDLVTRRVDEAIRIMIVINEEETVYAKIGNDGKPEEDPPKTTPFLKDKGAAILVGQRENLDPGDRDRITVVVWIEGEDPDCINYLIGGVMKMHMKITEEHITEK